jgi:transcriptional regulator with XRE-family HTH domain
MDLKAKVLEILEKEKYSFKELAEYVNMSEDALSTALETKKLELRTLELISKGLKIPLYSFFRTHGSYGNPNEKPYYVNKLWEDAENAGPLNEVELKEEIEFLKQLLLQKEDQLKGVK